MTQTSDERHGEATTLAAPKPHGGWPGLRWVAALLFRLMRLALSILIHGRGTYTCGEGTLSSAQTASGIQPREPNLQQLLELPADDGRTVVLALVMAPRTNLNGFALDRARGLSKTSWPTVACTWRNRSTSCTRRLRRWNSRCALRGGEHEQVLRQQRRST